MNERKEENHRENSYDFSNVRLFTGHSHLELAKELSHYLGIPLGNLNSTRFPDGEIRIVLHENVKDKDIFILQSTCHPVNENLMELLILIDVMKRGSARRINVILPYFGYARQDKSKDSSEPLTVQLVANLIVTAGADKIYCIDPHTKNIQDFFNIPVEILYGRSIISLWMFENGYQNENMVIVAPDQSSTERAGYLAKEFSVPVVTIVKKRTELNKVKIIDLEGDVKGKKCFIIDDLIDTGETVIKSSEFLMERGANEVVVACAHPVLSQNVIEKLEESVIKKIVVLDTIPISPRKRFSKLIVLKSVLMITESIKKNYLPQDTSTLLEGKSGKI